jgi:hypothetical protein
MGENFIINFLSAYYARTESIFEAVSGGASGVSSIFQSVKSSSGKNVIYLLHPNNQRLLCVKKLFTIG